MVDAPGIPLSVLDLSPIPSGASASSALRDTIEMARAAEAAGYRRFWLAEHHGIASVASSSPEVMIGAVAAATRTLRVGSGGIMLPNHAPLKVAETFRALAGLYPGPDGRGRIDLGIGRAPGTDARTAIALRRSREGRIQAVEASASTSSMNNSEGFFQLWILRGRSLMSQATIAR